MEISEKDIEDYVIKEDLLLEEYGLEVIRYMATIKEMILRLSDKENKLMQGYSTRTSPRNIY